MSATRRNRAVARLVGAIVLGAALLLPGPGASAEPPVAAKRAEAARVLTELRSLDDHLEYSIERYNLVRIKLAANARAEQTSRHHLGVVRRNLLGLQRRLAARLVYLYKNGESAPALAVILGARSLGELLDSLDTIRRVAAQEELLLDQVRTFDERLARQLRALRRERTAQTRLAAELDAQRAAIESRLSERRRLLATVEDEIAELQERERTRQMALRRQAQARLAAARQVRTPLARDLGVVALTPEQIAVAPDTNHAHVVAIAMQYLGVPYRWGGASPETGFDCSGFVMYVYAQVGVSLPHNAALQYGYGAPVAREDLQSGDLVFFNNLGHDGIYIGDGLFIQAPRTGDVVKISSLTEPWYAAGYVGARRLQ